MAFASAAKDKGAAAMQRRIAIITGVLAMALAQPSIARTPQQVAEAALRAAPVWDGHNDVPWQLRLRFKDVTGGLDFGDTGGTADPAGGRIAMQTDLARLRQGRVGAQFWSVYVPTDLSDLQSVQAVLEQIDVTRRLIARYPRDLQFAASADEVERAMRAGKVASLLGMEGGHAIAGSPAVLRQMYALGVRYMTLTHSANTPWADSATDVPEHGGLTDFGRDVVREMQRIGMLVDLSHVSEETMLDALEVARAPVMFSHSSARAIAAHPRNVPDSVLDKLKANGGVVMVTTVPTFVSDAALDWAGRRAANEAHFKELHPAADPAAIKAATAAWVAANPEVRATIPQLADHIDHIVRRAGVDHVGIGGDFDGIARTVQGMDDVSGYPALFAELARRGYSQADLEKIASRNMFRVMRAAEAYTAAHRDDPAIEAPTTF
jgi:membrane dipeptidase